MSVKIREKRGKLYLDIYSQGHRKWEALGLSLGKDKILNKEAWRKAETVRQIREQQIFSKKHGLIDDPGARQTILEYAKKKAEGRDSKDHVYRLIKVLENFESNIEVQNIDEQWVTRYKEYLLSLPLAKRTASHMFKALGYILRAAKLERLININPFENVKRISVPEKIHEYLNAEELEALAGTPLAGKLGAEVRRAFMFACYTGLRKGDIQSLTWGQIIRVPAPRIQKRQGKTGRIVSIPLSPAAWEIIKTDTLLRHDTPVFPLLVTRTDTNKYLLQWAERAKIEKHIGWHTARRTFATLALEAGADMSTVSRLLGHSGIQITALYAQSTDKAKRQAVDALPKINLKEAN